MMHSSSQKKQPPVEFQEESNDKNQRARLGDSANHQYETENQNQGASIIDSSDGEGENSARLNDLSNQDFGSSDEEASKKDKNEFQQNVHKSRDDAQEEVSENGSEIFETDSSDNEVAYINQDQQSYSPMIPPDQGKDIVAGSPTKLRRRDSELDEDAQEVVPEEQKGRIEMNGTIIYDSYAKLTGCEKIVNYHSSQQQHKIDTKILFKKDETKDVIKTLFQEKVRERDFQNDWDRALYKNLPKFATQRDFSEPSFEIYIPQQQNVLIFDSRFENGNLRKVAKVNNIEYNLWLENDLNTKGHNQWYYFKVLYKDIASRADKKTHKIKFNVLNLAKTTSLYQQGMKPWIWSKRKHDEDGTGWFLGGEEITYRQNDIPRDPETGGGKDPNKMKANENNTNAFLYNNNGAGEGVDFYFTLSFKYEFKPNTDDELWFAHAVPYTFTKMQESLDEMRQKEEHKGILKFNLLCQSLARNPVPLMTITDSVETYLDYYEELRILNQVPGIVKKAFRQKFQSAMKLAHQAEQAKGSVRRHLQAAQEEEIKQFFEQYDENLLTVSPHFQGFMNRMLSYIRDHGAKKAIFITSRVHPGEPQASHMLDGLIEYLLSPDADQLRKHFVIRIVPFLNPDGVIYGNYRCSLLGCDLNRKWDKPNRLLHPTIFYSKQLIRHMHMERKVTLFCDLHGHSRKKNAFFYGCCYKNYEAEGRIKNAQLRLIPLMCCQKNKLFKLKDCRFRLEQWKTQTARVVIFKEFNIMNSFTLECSFFGKEYDPKKDGPLQQASNDPFAILQKVKKQIIPMDVKDYQSMGTTVMQIMNNYLPSEEHKLQFLSGKILDVFYDEFIKFVPPYILKREEEKRKKHEESNPAGAPSTFKVAQPTKNGPPLSKLASGNVNEIGAVQQTVKRKQTYMPGYQGVRALMSGPTGTAPYQDLVAPLGSKTSVRIKEDEENQSDNNQDWDDQEQRNYPVVTVEAVGEPKADIIEFESFMDGIQSRMKRKEQQRQEREISKQNKAPANHLAAPDNLNADSDLSAISSDSSSCGGPRQVRPKKKKKKKPQTIQKAQEAQKQAANVAKKKSIPAANLEFQRKQTQGMKKHNFSKRIRSPKPMVIDPVAPVLRQGRAPPSKVETQKSDEHSDSDQLHVEDSLDDLQHQQSNFINSGEIQSLIKHQLNQGFLNQQEIIDEIQRAILLHQAQKNCPQIPGNKNEGSQRIANAVYMNAIQGLGISYQNQRGSHEARQPSRQQPHGQQDLLPILHVRHSSNGNFRVLSPDEVGNHQVAPEARKRMTKQTKSSRPELSAKNEMMNEIRNDVFGVRTDPTPDDASGRFQEQLVFKGDYVRMNNALNENLNQIDSQHQGFHTSNSQGNGRQQKIRKQFIIGRAESSNTRKKENINQMIGVRNQDNMIAGYQLTDVYNSVTDDFFRNRDVNNDRDKISSNNSTLFTQSISGQNPHKIKQILDNRMAGHSSSAQNWKLKQQRGIPAIFDTQKIFESQLQDNQYVPGIPGRNPLSSIDTETPSRSKNSPSKLEAKKMNKNVMRDLKDQIAKESQSHDLVQKQQHLQLQLERQQKLLWQLQAELMDQQHQQKQFQKQGDVIVGHGIGAMPGGQNAQAPHPNRRTLVIPRDQIKFQGMKPGMSKNPSMQQDLVAQPPPNFSTHQQSRQNNENTAKTNPQPHGRNNTQTTDQHTNPKQSSQAFKINPQKAPLVGIGNANAGPSSYHKQQQHQGWRTGKGSAMDQASKMSRVQSPKTPIINSTKHYKRNGEEMLNAQHGSVTNLEIPSSMAFIGKNKQSNISNNYHSGPNEVPLPEPAHSPERPPRNFDQRAGPPLHQYYNSISTNPQQHGQQQQQPMAVANYVQNINVFVSDPTNCGRMDHKGFGYGIGQGIVGGLGRSDQGQAMGVQIAQRINHDVYRMHGADQQQQVLPQDSRPSQQNADSQQKRAKSNIHANPKTNVYHNMVKRLSSKEKDAIENAQKAHSSRQSQQNIRASMAREQMQIPQQRQNQQRFDRNLQNHHQNQLNVPTRNYQQYQEISQEQYLSLKSPNRSETTNKSKLNFRGKNR